jgi:hypothetical protein
MGGTGGVMRLICATCEAGIFLIRGVDTISENQKWLARQVVFGSIGMDIRDVSELCAWRISTEEVVVVTYVFE